MLFCYFILYCTIYFYHADLSKLPRYVVEPDVKPAIFGSYSYDVIKGDFVLPNSTTTDISLTDIIFNNTSPSSVQDDNFRKHVAVTETIKSLNWWTHAKLFLSNSTHKFRTNQTKVN
ncbi:uncharacterized protein LOC126780600 isoform X2 [Nymphalis io]|uniref:uncharacterized protein LOC126780600 isoform X2 n=1 Tax=Inachis io TaxID=171585 RepID=UPI00216A2AFF|nr:uncharacterized protein LOC126780600 isoform X2 [Nymphalis io]